MNNNPIIEIKNISYKYQNQLVLENINLIINRGEFLGLIGPNGSGKTTLLKIILGLLKPTSGSIRLFGQDIKNFNQWSKIGYIPQKAGSTMTNFPITVEEIVSLGQVQKEDKKAITEALLSVNMNEYRKKLLTELSGGQQQRVFIAKALASKPELLILDEPTVGVDIESQTKFYKLLKELNKQKKLTLVLVSHDINAVAHEVTQIACLNSTLICHGSPGEVLNNDFIKRLYSKDLKFVLHDH